MTRSLQVRFFLPLRRSVWLVSVAMVLLWGALTGPMGLAISHGVAAVTVLQHDLPRSGADHHEHEQEHEQGSVAADDDSRHAHHDGDHSHETAHAIPAALTVASQQSAPWRTGLPAVLPGRSVPGLERPPRG